MIEKAYTFDINGKLVKYFKILKCGIFIIYLMQVNNV